MASSVQLNIKQQVEQQSFFDRHSKMFFTAIAVTMVAGVALILLAVIAQGPNGHFLGLKDSIFNTPYSIVASSLMTSGGMVGIIVFGDILSSKKKRLHL